MAANFKNKFVFIRKYFYYCSKNILVKKFVYIWKMRGYTITIFGVEKQTK